MSISTCQYTCSTTESTRTHPGNIDITLRDDGHNFRCFLSDEQALGLIAQMVEALATLFLAGNIDNAIASVLNEETHND